MNRHLGYRAALSLALALACVHVAFLLYAANFRSSATSSIIIYAAGAVILAFGLWVQSKIVRYLGAIFSWLSAAAVAWPLISGGRPVLGVGLIWVIAMGVLSLATAYTLTFSKAFSAEFAHEREKQPRYKALLRTAAIILLAAAAVVATLIDILHLTSL